MDTLGNVEVNKEDMGDRIMRERFESVVAKLDKKENTDMAKVSKTYQNNIWHATYKKQKSI